MVSLNEKNELFYTCENFTIELSKLYKYNQFNKENLQLYPNLSYEILRPSYTLKFKYNKNTFISYMTGVKFTLIDKQVSGVFYSFEHLEKILSKYGYVNPIYRPKKEYYFKPIKESVNFNFLDEIYIKENDNIDKYNKIYGEIQKEYNKENLEIGPKNIKVGLLSMNFNKYFLKSNVDNINLDKQLLIFKTSYRMKIFSDVSDLMKSEDKIYAICGPFGIGKSFTSLLLQKDLFSLNISTLYVNLLNSEEISNLKETLIKESFFLNLSKEKYISLAEQILNKTANSIWDIISLIDEYCLKENINFLLIIDQYKKDRDEKDNLLKLNVKSIFLLSSINDKDVKENLVSQIQGKKDLKFKYIYYISLGIDNSIKNLYLNYEDIKVVKCLEDFNFFPNTINLLENIFNWNILDFYNNQYFTILKKLSKFYKKYRLDYLSNLFTNKKINDSKAINPHTIGKDEFLQNINDIPLKYISYVSTGNNNFFELHYAFDYAKYPIENEINNYIGLQRFKTNAEASLNGGEFENIIKHKFILDKPLFEIDSFISVDKIVDMELVDEFKNIKIEELKKKNCIFIYQKNFRGEDYDFAVLYPKEEKIILIQAKYKITTSNVKKRSEYADVTSVSKITNSISQNFGINIKTIYLLYLSSVEYNHSNKNNVFKLLNSKEIKCIFYSVMKDKFTSDFKNNLEVLFPTTSMEIYPNANEYVKYSYRKHKNSERFLESLVNLAHKSQNDNAFIKDQYKKFLEYLKKTNIKNELKSHLGEFEIFFDNYQFFPVILFDIYLLFFKVNENQEIDFSKDLILGYDDDNENFVCYNLKTDKIVKNISLKDNNEFKNYHYAIGKWRIDQEMNLDEEKDII